MPESPAEEDHPGTAAADVEPGAVTSADVPADPSADPAARQLLHGVDVASYQGPPSNWRQEAGAIRWAGVKLTELQPNNVRYVNPDAAADWDYLAKNKLGRVAYMFGHPSVSASDSVSFFISELHSLGLHDADAVMLDLEVTDGLTPGQVDSWAAQVLASLESKLDRKSLLYTFLSFAEAGNTASLGAYPLWIADPSSPPGHPQVPAPWQTWTIHQYVITGPIDRDVANFTTLAAMSQALGKLEEPPLEDLGGSIAGEIVAVRWPNGVTIVAGLGTNGVIQYKRYHPPDNTWSPWRNLSNDKALGAPAMLAFGATDGRLFYTSETGAVIALGTNDAGVTWT